MFENAKWISYDTYDLDTSFLFRKEFEIEKEIKFAQLHICMLGLGVCTINGKKVTQDVLTTPFTKYDARVYYDVYEVSDLLSVGKNTIGVHCGNGFYNNNVKTWMFEAATWRAEPKFIARLDITYMDGTSLVIVSDKLWKTNVGGCVYNHARQGEIFDFNLAQKGFDNISFDDSEWKVPRIVPEPGGYIIQNDTVPIRIIRTIEPLSVKNGIYDFGENISGWVRIIATGTKGQEMSIKYDERLDENGDLKGYIDVFLRREGMDLANEDRVIFSGEEDEEYAPSFVYHGFRYVKLTNAPENIRIVAEVVHTDLQIQASFRSNDDMLNKIHEASVRSTLSNYHGLPTDCPHREQNGWTGDAHLSCEQASINFDMVKPYKKWIYDVIDGQRISGQIPCIVPNPGNWGFGRLSGLAWDSALFLVPWQLYETYGEISTLESAYVAMERYLNYVQRTSQDYIVDLGLGDWCPPAEQVMLCPAVVTSTAYYYKDLCIMSKTSQLLGKDSKKWEELAANVRKAWRNTYLNDEKLHNSQTFLACAIYQNLLTEEEKPIYARKLAKLVIDKEYHTDCGILGQKYIFSALSDYGYHDVVYKMITNPTCPSYAYWINSGMTTFCETWEMRNSCNHHMYGEVDTWFYKYLGGLRFDGGQLTIAPVYLAEVQEVYVTYKDVTVQRVGRTVTVSSKNSVYVIVGTEKVLLENDNITFDI